MMLTIGRAVVVPTVFPPPGWKPPGPIEDPFEHSFYAIERLIPPWIEAIIGIDAFDNARVGMGNGPGLFFLVWRASNHDRSRWNGYVLGWIGIRR